MLNNIISDLKNLEGQLVGKGSYFEKIYTNEAPINMISTLDVLENLKQYEINNFIGYNYDEDAELEVDFEDYLELYEYEEISADNSYNWLSPLTNHIDFRIHKSEIMNNIIVELKVHRFGDVRCNYTEECYLQFQDECEFIEVLSENNKNFTIEDEKENIQYNININILSDSPEIELIKDDEYEYYDSYEASEILEELLNKNDIEIL